MIFLTEQDVVQQLLPGQPDDERCRGFTEAAQHEVRWPSTGEVFNEDDLRDFDRDSLNT